MTDRQSLKKDWSYLAIILSNSVVAARSFHKGLPRLIHSGWLPVHTTQYAPLGNTCHDGGPCVSMGRSEAVGWVADLKADDRLSRRIRDLVIVEELNRLPWSRS